MERQYVGRDTGDDHRGDQLALYNFEHLLAWLLMIISVVLGVIGILRGFGVIGTELSAVANSANPGGLTDQKWDALVWLLPALSAGLLSMALHRTEHHLARNPHTTSEPREGMWNAEHWLAWLFAIGAIVLGIIALLVGFDVFDNANTPADGIVWGISSIGCSFLATALHSVRHHQLADDEEYIVTLVEERVRGLGGTTAPPVTRPETERNR